MQNSTPTEYSSLVNEDALFERSIKSAFTGQIEEVLAELLQNSQRAHALAAHVRCYEQGWWEYTDNGHGLLDGVASLHTLLRWGESRYQDQAVDQNQHPMGVGLYALICLKDIHSIRIRSGSVLLWIETQAWLHDSYYRRSWPTRVRSISEDEAVAGFQLLIGGTPELLENVRKALTETARTSYDPQIHYRCMQLGTAQGYDGLLAVFLDGEPVQTVLPPWLTLLETADIVTAYQGNLLRIKLFPNGPQGVTINWYGQTIVPHGPLGDTLPYQAYLEVRTGQPVHPMAPTRRGLVRDKSLADLALFLQDAIFSHILAQEKRSARAIQLLYTLNTERARQQCPFLVVQHHWALCHPEKIVSLDTVHKWERNVPVSVVHRNQLAQFLFLADEIRVYRQVKPLLAKEKTPPSWEPEDFSYGLWSFLAVVNLAAYRVLSPMVVPDELVRVLWWKPGPFEDDLYTRIPGEWGLGTWDTPPEQWQPLPADASVFAFGEAVSWSIDESEALIGTVNIAQFLSLWARIFWTRDIEEGDRSEEAYDASVDELITSYLPQTVQRSLAVWELPRALCSLFSAHGAQPADVRSVEFVYDKQVLNSLIAHFADGHTERVDLYPAWKPLFGGGGGETATEEASQV
ncbi:MAG TPA: hypothetical protein VFV38_01390 [Ktedonobacteraceae bacterium]|nr:hypothetical protein [Ktedonobacteraceae bacterium]